MAYILVACPKCHAGYKIQRESASAEVTCRACGHKWAPAPPAPAAAPQPEVGLNLAPADKAGAMQAMAEAHDSREGRTPLPKPAAADALSDMAQAASRRAPGSEDSRSSAADPVATPSRSGSVVREDKTDPLVGTNINGFKIQSRIGSGGFGVVYRAFDTNLERSVAIKMLPPKIARASQGLVERFLREARSAAKLSHPNIVTIHQICPYRDTYYIVMELVEGGALHEFLAVQKRFTPQEATRVIRVAAEGLGHAHRRGIIHRDIKPGNIMMTNDGQVKVSDFGLARDVLQGRDIVGPGHSLGTPRYMAPEQALGGEPTSASDLYSLAATYFALLTGHPPFEGSSDRELMKQHVTASVPDPRKYVPDLPVAAFRFFETAMAKAPEDRYQTAEDFVEALDRLDFSKASATASLAEALSSQIGKITAEDRGGHVTKAIERVAVKVTKQRTPLSASPMTIENDEAPPAKRSRVFWAVIVAAALAVIAGAVVAAFLLAPRNPGVPNPPEKTTEKPAEKPAGKTADDYLKPIKTTTVTTVTPPPGTPPAVPPAAPKTDATKPPAVTPPVVAPVKPPEKAVEKTPAKDPGKVTDKGASSGTTKEPLKKAAPPTKPAEPANPDKEIEAAAQAALDEVKAVEANSKPEDRISIIRMYKEIILDIKEYEKTAAYKEAQKAMDRLQAAEAEAPLTP